MAERQGFEPCQRLLESVTLVISVVRNVRHTRCARPALYPFVPGTYEMPRYNLPMKHALYVILWWTWFLSELLVPQPALARWWSMEPRWNGKRRWM